MNTQAATVPTGGAQPTAVNDTVGALAGLGKLDHHGTLTISGSNASPVTFSGTLDNSGGNTAATTRTFTKNGSGTQIYNGHVLNGASFLLGAVNAGNLQLNNAASADSLVTTGALSASTGGTISGAGVLNSPLTINVGTASANGGTLSPGDGTMAAGHRTFTVTGGTVTFGSSTTAGLPSSIFNVTLNTTVAEGDINTMLDATGKTLTIGTNVSKPKLTVTNAGTMTGGTYTIAKYGTLTNAGVANLWTLPTAPTNFIWKYDLGTANQIKLQVEFQGDFNNDNAVDAGDYIIWRKNNGLATGALYTQGDANGDGAVNGTDYTLWQSHFGNSITPAAGSGSGLAGATVPEPTALLLAVLGVFFTGMIRRRR